MSDSCARCGRTFRRHECIEVRGGKPYCQAACGDACEHCDALRHPDAHISDPCERCGHVEEHATELRALTEQLFTDDQIPF